MDGPGVSAQSCRLQTFVSRHSLLPRPSLPNTPGSKPETRPLDLLALAPHAPNLRNEKGTYGRMPSDCGRVVLRLVNNVHLVDSLRPGAGRLSSARDRRRARRTLTRTTHAEEHLLAARARRAHDRPRVGLAGRMGDRGGEERDECGRGVCAARGGGASHRWEQPRGGGGGGGYGDEKKRTWRKQPRNETRRSEGEGETTRRRKRDEVDCARGEGPPRSARRPSAILGCFRCLSTLPHRLARVPLLRI